MKPRRSLPVLQRDAGFRRPEFNCPRYIISEACEFVMVIWMFATVSYYFLYDLPPEFSVQLTPARGTGGMEAPAASQSSIPRAFDIALHASNRRATERCYHHGEGVVTYAGFTVASGRTPDFCMLGKGAREVPFQLTWDWEDGVGLPEHLRDRIVAAGKAGGGTELEVQVRLLQGDAAGSGRPTWMWCKMRMGAVHDVTPCTVFALQNWFAILA